MIKLLAVYGMPGAFGIARMGPALMRCAGLSSRRGNCLSCNRRAILISAASAKIQVRITRLCVISLVRRNGRCSGPAFLPDADSHALLRKCDRQFQIKSINSVNSAMSVQSPDTEPPVATFMKQRRMTVPKRGFTMNIDKATRTRISGLIRNGSGQNFPLYVSSHSQ